MALQSREDLIADLLSKKFRDAFVSSRVSNTLALQIRAMREERGWSQAHLAKLLGTSQNAVYRLESPQYGRYNITTLRRLASIFDVGLAVWFIPFSKLVDRVMNLSTEDILVPRFDDDPGFQENIAASASPEDTISSPGCPQ
jgi:transcriptional regulator with XRE-family HTH domain